MRLLGLHALRLARACSREKDQIEVESGGQIALPSEKLGLKWSQNGLNLVSAKKKELGFSPNSLIFLVDDEGFEPPTPAV